MKLLFLDTETTGLPLKRNTSIYDVDMWPHIIQLSFIVYDTKLNEITCKYDAVIQLPNYVDISHESILIHGITREQSLKTGVPIILALENLHNAVNICDIIVGHNVSFDKQILIVEYIRLNIKSNLSGKPTFCTMRNYTKLCNIPRCSNNNSQHKNSNNIKYPKLSELHMHVFDKEPSNLHNSFNDILICLRCYMKLEHDFDVLLYSSTFFDEYYKHFDSASLDLVTIY